MDIRCHPGMSRIGYPHSQSRTHVHRCHKHDRGYADGAPMAVQRAPGCSHQGQRAVKRLRELPIDPKSTAPCCPLVFCCAWAMRIRDVLIWRCAGTSVVPGQAEMMARSLFDEFDINRSNALDAEEIAQLVQHLFRELGARSAHHTWSDLMA